MTIDRTRVITKACGYCGAEFDTFVAAKNKYCSPAHARNAWRLLKDGESLDWHTGADTFGRVEHERTDLYEGTCLSCARVQGEYRLTAEQARQRALVGLPRCGWCSGIVLLDRALIRSRA
jgi:hypothetical protein